MSLSCLILIFYEYVRLYAYDREMPFSVLLSVTNPRESTGWACLAGQDDTDEGSLPHLSPRSSIHLDITEALPPHYQVFLHTYRYRIVPIPLQSHCGASVCRNNTRTFIYNSPNSLHDDSTSWISIAKMHTFSHSASTSLRNLGEDVDSKVTETDPRANYMEGFSQSISWSVVLPAGFILQANFKAQKLLISREYHPPDASRGIESSPAVITITSAGDGGKSEQVLLLTESPILHCPIPDLSMPFNAITLVSQTHNSWIPLVRTN